MHTLIRKEIVPLGMILVPLRYTTVPPSKAFAPLRVVYVTLRREDMPPRE